MVRFCIVAYVIAVALALAAPAARADKYDDCEQLADPDLAIRACSWIIRNGKRPETVSIAQAHSNRGYAYAEKGQFDRAIRDFNKAIKGDPKDDNAYNYRGVAYMKKKQYARALADFNKAIGLEPNNFYAYNNRALAYLKSDKMREALRSVNKAIKLNPEQASFYETRGRIHEALEKKEKAIQDYGSAYHLSPLERYKKSLERLGVSTIQ